MSTLGIENLTGNIQIERPDMRIESQGSQTRENPGLGPSGADASGGKTFAEVFEKSVDKVNQYQTQADQAIKELVAGRTKNIHETMLAIERADVSLKLMMQVRNKIIDAYREIMRMQI